MNLDFSGRTAIVTGAAHGIGAAIARRLAAELPRGSFSQVDNSAHAVQFHRPEAFTRLLLEFLAGVTAVAAAR